MFGFGRVFDEMNQAVGQRMTSFNTQYKCYSIMMLPGQEREDVERGGKIIMPPSALDHLSRLHISYPMLFKLSNLKASRTTHCGVLEFVADEGKIYLPYWMMENLLVSEGDLVGVTNCTLPVASYSRFQPLSPDFLDISNPKAVLENALRNFACLSKDDVISIQYNSKKYNLCVLEVRPGNAVSIIECDMSVEFATPIGYEHPQSHKPKEDTQVDGGISGTPDVKKALEEYMQENEGFQAFHGQGNRLDGKKKNTEGLKSNIDINNLQRGIPNYNWSEGTFKYIRNNEPPKDTDGDAAGPSFSAFEGEGKALRKKKRQP
ncbi:ubiquitin recognition factor in ER-associated degradation protein 1-like [Styela clava]|uniref:ubiquitin recognition factor in ER-associated degradation protein 1-like n=1 Tax=Styela clava TaxID=7725 RepID=UPI00193A7627|nr:ubiquitin recognition factor in ER-associated degradation protein 1-like [Styela clava]